MSAQLEFAVLPVADPRAVAEVRVELWLERVLAAARDLERRDGQWWAGEALAASMGEPTSRVGPALRCLERRGAMIRDRLEMDTRGRIIFVWAVGRAEPLDLEGMLERLGVD